MSKKFVTVVLLFVCAVFALSAASAQANSASRTPAGTTRAVKFTTVSAAPAASVMAANLFQVPLTSSAEADKKKKAVAAEPATWMYVLGAVLLVVVIERKALKALFHSSPSN